MPKASGEPLITERTPVIEGLTDLPCHIPVYLSHDFHLKNMCRSLPGFPLWTALYMSAKNINHIFILEVTPHCKNAERH